MKILSCNSCRLCETRTQIVNPIGPKDAKVILIGEAPGTNEDKGGEPFIGRSGKLLFKLLEEELGLKREDCYITNTVKCRPPNNRKPKKDEIEACSGILKLELDYSKIPVIITLGRTAGDNLINYQNKKVYKTLHPAAALYRTSLMSKIREDLKGVQLN